MKIGKRWLGIFFAFALVLSLFISLTEVEAAKKTKTKYLKAKKIEVTFKYNDKSASDYGWREGTTLLSYKNENKKKRETSKKNEKMKTKKKEKKG